MYMGVPLEHGACGIAVSGRMEHGGAPWGMKSSMVHGAWWRPGAVVVGGGDGDGAVVVVVVVVLDSTKPPHMALGRTKTFKLHSIHISLIRSTIQRMPCIKDNHTPTMPRGLHGRSRTYDHSSVRNPTNSTPLSYRRPTVAGWRSTSAAPPRDRRPGDRGGGVSGGGRGGGGRASVGERAREPVPRKTRVLVGQRRMPLEVIAF